jgi:hypothetical protein
MEKPEIVIGNFIRLNSSSFNNMKQQAPEVADAFSKVLGLIAKRYAKIPIPTSQPTTLDIKDIGTMETLPGLTIFKKDINNFTHKEAFDFCENINKQYGLSGDDKWRLPTAVEMNIMNNGFNNSEIKKTVEPFEHDIYWISLFNQGFSTVRQKVEPEKGIFSKIMQLAFRPVSGTYDPSKQTTTPSSKFKVGDRIKVVNEKKVYSAYEKAFRSLNFKNKLVNEFDGQNGDLGVIFAIANHSATNDEMLAINLDSGKQILIKSEGVELVNQNTTTQTQSGVKQRIETLPEFLSVDYHISENIGDRKSPTQSAGQLKKDFGQWGGNIYEQELLNTYFRGNDGEWYKINVEKGGVWKWKKDNPPANLQTQSTVNRDYQNLSQMELQKLKRDTQAAMEAFEPEDDEYKELQQELETIELFIEN